MTHIKGYRISLVNNRVTIAHLKESNPDTPAVHLDEAGVLRLGARSFESWIIQTGRGVRGDPKPHFATADYPGLNADVRRLPDGWILNPDHITLVDTKAMQVTTLKSGAPTASGPDEKAISQAQDYGHITSLEAEWVHVTPEGTRIPLPCTKVRYYFNNQVVADIWCPKLRRYIEPERLESEPAPRT